MKDLLNDLSTVIKALIAIIVALIALVVILTAIFMSKANAAPPSRIYYAGSAPYCEVSNRSNVGYCIYYSMEACLNGVRRGYYCMRRPY